MTNSPSYRPPSDAALALESGHVLRGKGFGANVDTAGEVVFTTTMTGYQEVSTDPSFFGQIVCMTYPLIGNYGVNNDDNESRQSWISGMAVRELSESPSNWRSSGTMHEFLELAGVPGISGIDTRALTRLIRSSGDMRGVLVRDAADIADEVLVERAQRAPLPGDSNVVDVVSDDRIVEYGAHGSPHIVVVDCGVKRNIVRSLLARGAKVTVLPYGTPYSDLAALKPEGVIVSPGPGDPANLDDGLDVVTAVLNEGVPYFGICLGHQLLARAIGAETSKLKFGHRGGNHPVRDLQSGAVSITSQNHGYQVEGDSLPKDSGWNVALLNLNDQTVEGLRHQSRPVISVQFHPEASPGPLDTSYLFDEFLALVREVRLPS